MEFEIEIRLDRTGISAVRVYGLDWEKGAEAYALLSRVGAVIQRLDEVAKFKGPADQMERAR
jgi:hypothetical protein